MLWFFKSHKNIENQIRDSDQIVHNLAHSWINHNCNIIDPKEHSGEHFRIEGAFQ